jgi:hypothetical protein
MGKQTTTTNIENVTIERFNKMMHFDSREGEDILTQSDYDNLEFFAHLFSPRTKNQITKRQN